MAVTQGNNILCTMKAQIIHAFDTPYRFEDIPAPNPPQKFELLIQVGAASYCHTDTIFASGRFGGNLPMVSSHEFAGTIVALGPDVSQFNNTNKGNMANLEIGTRVGVAPRPFNPCGKCWECHNAPEDQKSAGDGTKFSLRCPQASTLGINVHGGFAEYAIVDCRQVVTLPDSISFVDAAPLMCAGYTIFSAFKKGDFKPGSRIGIVGCGGGLGHVGLQFGVSLGYQMVGIEVQDGPLQLAKDLGTGAKIFDARISQPDDVIDAIDGGVVKDPHERGVDAVMILPETQKALDYGMKILRYRGTCMMISTPAEGFHVSSHDVVLRDIKIIGVLPGRRAWLQEMFEVVAEKGIRPVSKKYALSQVNELVKDCEKGQGVEVGIISMLNLSLSRIPIPICVDALGLRRPLITSSNPKCVVQPSTKARRRGLLTLAIESSCDDTSVAIVEKDSFHKSFETPRHTGHAAAEVHFLENITADTRKYRGIHPIEALQSHQENLAKLVQKAVRSLPPVAEDYSPEDGAVISHIIPKNKNGKSTRHRLPNFISVTRGPGMRSNLSVGLDTAKGLAVAWQIPLVGVHHMQAHLLTPRLVSALNRSVLTDDLQPNFPFLSILVSGGHSMLVHSKSLLEHEILATTADIAIGETLDKSARLILPESVLESANTTMYGKLLEKFAFPGGPADYADYQALKTRGEEVVKRDNDTWGWSFTTPYANTRDLKFSFSSVSSTVSRIMANKEKADVRVTRDERVALARESMRVCFEHLASRTLIALELLRKQLRKQYNTSGSGQEIDTLVVSGGVAANQFLMTVLRAFLDVRGFSHIKVIAPPPYLCTDNAAMIGWAGIEMFEAGYSTDLSCRAIRKWTLDPSAGDGGILGPEGWIKRNKPGP
ncbi:glycoprotease family protein, putative [Talaromyces stipitatus ATCC 10500]|uniref:Glycoprotease family protein, putative n=1 Tax=Talaromyces stipitatus (strain ATCC 10500 / CBS 375.48 / QM 6759 / NRRL 1006) TaxID=441959 RepID=B8MFK9_TALSN|nr:glycoprotease family protein, putative [Talaromyces stipitatus ATCC 10500]EED16999.1 glycoprotease family protein, putative [Talaromyces stipitatus ATCC 10500]